MELFVWLLNWIENRIQYVLEIKKDNFLPFLDGGMMKRAGKLFTKVYRKPNHTHGYIN